MVLDATSGEALYIQALHPLAAANEMREKEKERERRKRKERRCLLAMRGALEIGGWCCLRGGCCVCAAQMTVLWYWQWLLV
jgi:hypothetical protein